MAAARHEFSEHGYDGATIGAIASRAGVDSALVHHYFGTKEKLFVAAIELPFDPAWVAEQAAAVPREGLGEQIARTFIHIWDDPRGRGPSLAALRSAMTQEKAANMLREFVTRTLLAKVSPLLGEAPDRELRFELMVAHLIGVGMLRYVVQIEPLASARDEDVIAMVAPVIQQYVDTASPTPPSPRG